MFALDEKLVADRYEEAARTWPEVRVGVDRFREAIRGALGQEQAVDGVHTSDLYLVLGCLDGQPRAVSAFERHFMEAVRGSIERACRGTSTSADDVMQWTREKLLVGAPPVPPKLKQYTGRGSLLGWVRVVAIREALQDRRRSKRERVADDVSMLEGGEDRAVNMELEMLRERHAASFRSAVEKALRRLSPEQRSLLRFYTRDRLTIDELAPLLGVHRATAARRLEKARIDALTHTRAILHEEHGLSESEAKSLCVALGSEIDVSVARALADTVPP